MKISSRFKRNGRILLKGKHFCSKCLIKGIKHEKLLRKQPNQKKIS